MYDCTYACIYVCMYLCMYVCMYVCVYACIQLINIHSYNTTQSSKSIVGAEIKIGVLTLHNLNKSQKS